MTYLHDTTNGAGLEPNWLNDAVAEMMPPLEDASPRTVGAFGSARVSVASPEYLLAMKAMVSRKSPGDLDDAAILCNILHIADERQVAAVVSRYFGSASVGSQELWFQLPGAFGPPWAGKVTRLLSRFWMVPGPLSRQDIVERAVGLKRQADPNASATQNAPDPGDSGEWAAP